MSTILPEDRIAEFGHSKLCYRISGKASDLPDFVLEHGGGGSADDWNAVVPLLAAHGRVLSYDRAGMGASASDGLGCGAAVVSDRLAQLVRHVGVRKPFILVGYSRGGLYARHYAQTYPQDVAALVLADASPIGSEVPQHLIRKAMRMLWLLHWAARSGLATLYWHLSGKKIEGRKFRRGVRHIASSGYLATMREELNAITGIHAEVAQVAPTLRHPTLAVITGTAPGKMTAEQFAQVRALHEQLAESAPMPLSRLTVVAGATHSTLVSQPQYAAELAEQTLAFARSLSGAGPDVGTTRAPELLSQKERA
jgi:pimeloyl-ACP methyl ester carboxylesterase